jgi:hypothetical protein
MAAVLALAAPGAASAKPRTYKVPPSTLQLLQLRGTHGYRLNLTVEDHGLALLSASDYSSRPALAFVTYSTRKHPHTAPDTLHLKLGDEGSFRGRFVAKATKREAVSAPCKGEPSVVEEGFFVGEFDFHGAGGFTEAHRARAAGSVIRSAAQVCHGPRRNPRAEEQTIYDEPEEEAREVRLIAGRQSGLPLFQALRYEEPTVGESVPPSTSFVGSAARTSHGVQITSDIVLLAARDEAFKLANPLEPLAGATVTPPAPFSGSATFTPGAPPASRWIGDLAVELPIFGGVALTGPAIVAGICVTPGHCTKTLPPKLRPLGSGGSDGSYYARRP